MEDKARQAEEVSGELIVKAHAASVLMGIMDNETLKHVAMIQGAMKDPEIMKRKALEFINMMAPNEMEATKGLASFGEPFVEWDWKKEEQGPGDGSGDDDGFYGFGEKCHTCGGVGHYSRECPTRGKGNGPG